MLTDGTHYHSARGEPKPDELRTLRVLAGIETHVEYVYVACNCRVWEFWAILYGKMGASCRRHPYI